MSQGADQLSPRKGFVRFLSCGAHEPFLAIDLFVRGILANLVMPVDNNYMSIIQFAAAVSCRARTVAEGVGV